MRKFLVYYRVYQYGSGEYEYYRSNIELELNEKANLETIEKKVNSWGCSGEEVLSWSLIEE